jgi:hypothetical protein
VCVEGIIAAAFVYVSESSIVCTVVVVMNILNILDSCISVYLIFGSR